jgi:hypothetical protein
MEQKIFNNKVKRYETIAARNGFDTMFDAGNNVNTGNLEQQNSKINFSSSPLFTLKQQF